MHRLMRVMGLNAIYRKPGISRWAPGAKVYLYLSRNASITRTNQVWAGDITYLPMARGHPARGSCPGASRANIESGTTTGEGQRNK